MAIDFNNPDYLYELARSGSEKDRAKLAEAMHEMLGTKYREIATDILLLLLREAEHNLRILLAEKLATQRECPMELIQFLIYESPFLVADPVLRQSALLDDEELIRILDTFLNDPQYVQAIAQRQHISAQVSMKILEQKNDQADLLLLKNKGSELNDICMDYLIDLAKKRPLLQQPLLQRREITAAVAAKLFWHVSTELRQHILENFPIDAIKLDRAMEQSIQHQLDIKTGAVAITDKDKIKAERLKDMGGLSVRQTIEALRRGDIPLFVCLIALTTHTQPEKIMDLLVRDTTETLTVIAHTLRLSRSDFNGLYLLWRRQTQPNTVLYEQDISRAQDTFAMISETDAKRTLRQWQDDSVKLGD